MNTGGDAANEMVQYYFEAIKCAATITGKGAEHALGILLNEMKNHKQTKGKVRLNSILKSGKPLKIFTMQKKDLAKFTKEAKSYGVLYCALVNRKNNNLYAIGKALYQEYFENEKYTSNYETKQLSDVTTNNRNKIDQSKEYKVLSAVNTGNLVLSDDYFDKQVYSKDIGKYLNVNKYDFAYNPARINIGSIGLNTFDFNCCVSPVYITFSVDKDYIDFFDFYFKSKKFNAEVTLRASGSVRQALNYNDFGMIEIPYPTKEMIDKFNNSYKTLKERININKIKIRNLEQLRDTLLPKLMNGEIDLDKVEI